MNISRRKTSLRFGATLAALGAALAVAGCGSSSSPPKAAAAASRSAQQVQQVRLEIQTSGPGHAEWPRYVPADFTVHAGVPVRITIVNHDGGTAPLSAAMQMYDAVAGGEETLNGARVTTVENKKVAHTFTIPELGINAVIPAAPEGSTNTVTFSFTPKKAGTFEWHCYAPCGEGKEGMSGAMSTSGWMEGRLTVES
ncbi:MAG TPA: hypothetical protein VKU89_08935 [Solirubrobacteraceae bacterium]|nr:hypothetical protein [Solirubrobacteraceae bacterium]